MRVSVSIFVGLLFAVSTSMAQSNARADSGGVAPLPNTQCRFDRMRAIVMRVKDSAPWEISAFLDTPIHFPEGTLVSVSRRTVLGVRHGVGSNSERMECTNWLDAKLSTRATLTLVRFDCWPSNAIQSHANFALRAVIGSPSPTQFTEDLGASKSGLCTDCRPTTRNPNETVING